MDDDVVADLFVDETLHRRKLFRLRRFDVREIEPQAIGRDERTGLPLVLAEHLAQRRMQQVRGGVVTLARAATAGIDLRRHRVVHGDPSLDDAPAVHDQPLGRVLCVRDGDAASRRDDLAAVAGLAAAFGIERGLEQHDFHGLARLGALLHAGGADDSGDGRRVVRPVVADELCLDVRKFREGGDALRLDLELRRCSPALTLGRHLAREAFGIDGEPLARGDLLRQLQWIAERVVELERLRAGQFLSGGRGGQGGIELDAAALQRLAELHLLGR